MSSRSADKIKMTSFDDLFGGTKGEETEEGKILRIPLGDLHSFKNHPFHVADDEKMMETVESIKRYGVLVPGIVRCDKESGYEIIAGHRRKRGSELAGCYDMPVIIRTLTDDEATIIMVDSNIQRENILPSEKAWAYRMKMEALSHQGVKGDAFTADLVGESAGESGRTVQRYIRLTYLKPEILEYVDQRKIPLLCGEKLSFLTEEEQGWVLQVMDENSIFPTKSQAEALKEESCQKTLSLERAATIMVRKEKIQGLTLPAQKIRSYFPSNFKKNQIEAVIFELLDTWKEKQSQQNT